MLRSTKIACLLILSMPVFADGPDYSYVEGNYERIRFDDAGVDGDGLSLGGSVELASRWHLFANYNALEFDSNVDLDEFSVGGGYHMPLTERIDLFANLALVRYEFGSSGSSLDDDGLGTSIGVRGISNDRLELSGVLTNVNFERFANSVSFTGTAWYSFMPNLAAGFKARVDEDGTRYGIGLRFYFDN